MSETNTILQTLWVYREISVFAAIAFMWTNREVIIAGIVEAIYERLRD